MAARGWWIVHSTMRPRVAQSDAFSMILSAAYESRPDVGSAMPRGGGRRRGAGVSGGWGVGAWSRARAKVLQGGPESDSSFAAQWGAWVEVGCVGGLTVEEHDGGVGDGAGHQRQPTLLPTRHALQPQAALHRA